MFPIKQGTEPNKYLAIEDVFDVQENGIEEIESQNLTDIELSKQVYRNLMYFHKTSKLNYEPCPICLTGSVGVTRTCRSCGFISCAQCYLFNWYHFPTAKRTRAGNYLIEDKICNLCHTECPKCHDVFRRSDAHECTPIASPSP